MGLWFPNCQLKSQEYQLARRSVRLWPIAGETEEDIWGNVGDFIHDVLRVPHGDVKQDNIVAVERVRGEVTVEGINDQVIVVFADKKERDLVLANSVHLASCVDRAGKPTAGTRLEIPIELRGTFRLLARFGTRLRARHGAGTKRHIKFDDYRGSLYTNIKLPGDTTWTRVSADMARLDLEKSMREEDTVNQKRLAFQAHPWPKRETEPAT